MPIKLISGAGGSLTVEPASTASNYTLTVPAVTANVVTTGDSNTITQTMIGSNVVGTGPTFSAYKSSSAGNQTLSGTAVVITFDAILFNIGSAYSTSTNRFTPQIAGYYLITASLGTQSSTSNPASTLYISKNGDVTTQGLTATSGYVGTRIHPSSASATNFMFGMSAIAYMNGTTDYISIYSDYGVVLAGGTGGSDRTFFMAHMIRAA